MVEIYDFDVTDKEVPWYVMEFLEGASLAELRERLGTLSPAHIGRILSELGEALMHAHEHGVVHRDLKPANVFLARQSSRRSKVKLLDFGIAKRIDLSALSAAQLTSTGVVMGTPMYLAPEQVDAGAVSAATDQYALALIVAELLIGEPWRLGLSISRIASEEILFPLDVARLPEGIGAALSAALVRATQPRPADRFPSIADFVAACALPVDAELTELLEAFEEPATTVRITEGRAGAASARDSARARRTPDGSNPQRERSAIAATTPAENQLAATTTPLPYTIDPLSAPARRVRPRMLLWTLLTVLLAFATAAAIRWRAAPAAPQQLSGSVQSEVPVPADAREILDVRNGIVVLDAGSALVLRPLDPAGESSRVELQPGTRIVGALESHEIVLHQPPNLVARAPEDGSLRVLAQLPALDAWPGATREPRRMWIDHSGQLLCVRQGQLLELFAIGAGALRSVARIPVEPSVGLRIALSDRHLAVFSNASRTLALYASDGPQRWQRSLDEPRVHALDLDEGAGVVAVVGWFPKLRRLELTDGNELPAVDLHGNNESVLQLADGRVAVGGDSGVVLVGRDGKVDPLANAGSGIAGLHWGGGHLAVLDVGKQRLRTVNLGGPRILTSTAFGDSELWTLARDTQQRLYVGGRDGKLYRRTDAGVDSHALHADGITDLVLDDTHLASASDDRTIAVWQLSDMRTAYRSRSHDFLVNQLWLQRPADQAGPATSLWSSSHDGKLKRWSWPDLGEQEAIDVNALTGKSLQLHALWMNASSDRALVGTWNHQLLLLQRAAPGIWIARGLPVASQATYRLVALPQARAVFVVGLYPSRLWLFDLDTGALQPLPDHGQEWTYAATGLEGGQVWTVGIGAIGHFKIERSGEALQHTGSVTLCSSCGSLSVLLAQQTAGTLTVADSSGRVHELDVGVLDGATSP